MGEDLLDDIGVLNARNDSHRPAAGRAGLDVDPDQIAGSDFEQPQADPKGEGQDARNNTRLRRCAQVIAARRSAGVGSSVSAGLACRPPLPRLAGVTRARYLLLGAKTPWVRLTRGFGTRAASRAMKSRGSNMTWVVLSR